MATPYMNVRTEPLNLQGALGGFFRSAATGFLQRPADEEELQSNGYTTMRDQEAALQDEYGKRWDGVSNSAGGFWSSIGGALGGAFGREQPKAEPDGFFGKARTKGLVHTISGGFFDSEEDDDFASTCCPSMGFKQRIIGCIVCVCLGQLFQFLSLGAATRILIGRPGKFAFLWSLGNFMMMLGSFFLSGPKRQCNKIRSKDRLLTFSVFLSTMLLTMFVVFSGPFWFQSLLILALVVVQWLAQVWYILSYVPYGQSVGRRVVRRVMKCIFPQR